MSGQAKFAAQVDSRRSRASLRGAAATGARREIRSRAAAASALQVALAPVTLAVRLKAVCRAQVVRTTLEARAADSFPRDRSAQRRKQNIEADADSAEICAQLIERSRQIRDCRWRAKERTSCGEKYPRMGSTTMFTIMGWEIQLKPKMRCIHRRSPSHHDCGGTHRPMRAKTRHGHRRRRLLQACLAHCAQKALVSTGFAVDRQLLFKAEAPGALGPTTRIETETCRTRADGLDLKACSRKWRASCSRRGCWAQGQGRSTMRATDGHHLMLWSTNKNHIRAWMVFIKLSENQRAEKCVSLPGFSTATAVAHRRAVANACRNEQVLAPGCGESAPACDCRHALVQKSLSKIHPV